MASLSLGLGILGAGLAGRVAYQLLRGGKGAAEQFVKGGFKAKMDKAEAMAVLGLSLGSVPEGAERGTGWSADLDRAATLLERMGGDMNMARRDPLLSTGDDAGPLDWRGLRLLLCDHVLKA
ncbi:uncharacterized protein MKK02DRAFT_39837 [Dioszegia hungarica]|uniref:Uncharacterized protein n=1 Tax=Dioszegia hungarica TaxID=4972 RepID=A0AA38HHG0_9TREE|nr:uncharacterized protein MKK02DRAFT_39837 [Dioszegia hungarica]KAI9639529.1 hypothetical protein MKK02DRAFT_39837 [Dioszegia hungarica]